MYILDISTSSRAPLANNNGLHLVAADHSVQCQAKSDGVRTTTVEKANAGIHQCLGSAVFSLGTKQQPSECRLCSHILASSSWLVSSKKFLTHHFLICTGLTWHGCPYKIDEVRFVRMHDSMMSLALSRRIFFLDALST